METCFVAGAEDNTTLSVIGPDTTNIPGNLTIGATGTNNALIITNERGERYILDLSTRKVIRDIDRKT